MKTLYFLFIGLLVSGGVFAQSCLPEGITFETQAQIDSFQIIYPNCTEIEGDVWILGSDITNLNGLSVLTSIGENLWIWDASALTSLTGLDNLTSIRGSLFILYNSALVNLTGFDNLTSISGHLWITYNSAMTSLSGLENLDSIGSLYIGTIFQGSPVGNPSLTSLTGLEGLDFIGNDVDISHNDVLTSFTGLDNVTSIGGGLWIWSNPALTSFTGLGNLNSIGGVLDINGNDALTSLTGLENLDFIGNDVFIGGNALASLTGLESLNSIGGILRIGSHALTSLTALENLNSIGGGLEILYNDTLTTLTGLDNVTSIGGSLNISHNDALTNLAGLDNIDPASINDLSIVNNPLLSTCSVQSICNYLLAPNGEVNIYDNAVGCNGPPEIANDCGINLPCLPYGNYYFSSQNDIDGFAINYPNCTILEGHVVINGEDIYNLLALNSITSIGGILLVYNNDALTNLTGLDNVTSIGEGLRISGNNVLSSLTGLENLASVSGFLDISGNHTLSGLTGLENVVNIEGLFLDISYNHHLISLAGLDNINADSIEDLSIRENPLLSHCAVLSICNYLNNPTGSIEIEDNVTGCDSPEEVQDSCYWVSVDDLYIDFANSLFLHPNPASHLLTISTDNQNIDKINIFNLTGQKVLEQRPSNNVVDVSGLKSGMYIIEVVLNNQKFRKKLLIQ